MNYRIRDYRNRIADTLLKDKLEAIGAVLIQGPKWCGKTTTALQFANSVIFLQDPQVGSQALLAAEVNPSLLLEGDTPRLIDEWQLAPQLWDAVRHEVDMRNMFGQFIMTGSTTPVENMAHRHSGTGRISKLMMRPMTLMESGDSNAQISLKDLFQEKKTVQGISSQSIENIAYLICRGGWPKAIGLPERIALQQSIDYVDSTIDSHLVSYDGVQRNPERVRSLLRSYARFIATDTKISSIHKDIVANYATLSYETTTSYITTLKQLFVIEDLPAWNPKLRSKTAIRSSDVHHYVDPSIATAALGASPADLLNDLETMGLLFESLCVRDLRVYAQLLDGTLYHYRDKSNLECDIVIHLRNGTYGLVEVKLGGTHIDIAADHLKKLAEKIDTSYMQKPAFLMVLTAGQYAYTRPDGIHVVPLACLGP
jgi:predicted AAA+ superfamily ATPase